MKIYISVENDTKLSLTEQIKEHLKKTYGVYFSLEEIKKDLDDENIDENILELEITPTYKFISNKVYKKIKI